MEIEDLESNKKNLSQQIAKEIEELILGTLSMEDI